MPILFLYCALLATSMLANENSSAYKNFYAECELFRWSPHAWITPPQLPQIPNLSPCETDACRVILAEILVQQRRYDDAHNILNERATSAEDFALFDVSLAARRELVAAQIALRAGRIDDAENALAAFEKQLIADASNAIARRHREIATLLASEIDRRHNNEKDSLSSLAESLSQIEQKLGEGKTDSGVQKSQQDALDSLEKMLKSLEAQLSQPSTQAQGGGTQSERPMFGGLPPRTRAAGEVNDRDFDEATMWGNLPPRERESVLMKLQREFPPLYRELIEGYFREIARERK